VSRSPVTATVAGFAAGLAAAVLIVGVSGSSGAFDSTTTVVRERVATAVAAQPVQTSRPGRPSSFDPGGIYRARIAGVVTITSVLDGDEEIGGSGFVVTDDGVILTNAHVVTNSGDGGVQADDVREARAVYVRFADGEQVEAEVVGYDLFDDVAVVRVSAPSLVLEPVPLGRSDRVAVGQSVAAIGSPFSQAGSLSVGIVSALDRSIPTFVTRYSIPGAIQTDAAINHGNSGGPLFDARGRVIGINAQINTTGGGGEGVGFAVPIDAARRSMDQILADGRVSYGWLGVSATTVTATMARELELPAPSGALVEAVSASGPADRAGLRAGDDERAFQDVTVTVGGDVITAVDGRPIESADDLVEVMAGYAADQRVRITFWRDGARQTAVVELAERPLAPVD
jgi:S1-C subfamily serine protease